MKREYPDRPIVGVGGVVVRGDRALVVRRATEPLKGEWSIPGGMLELGEKLREGVAREVLEETGLEVRVSEVLEVFDSIFPGDNGRPQYHYVLVDYLCHFIAGDAVPATDVSEVKWVSANELDSLEMRDATVSVILKALRAAKQ